VSGVETELVESETIASRESAVVRELASHQYGPGSIQAWCDMWAEFVVGSRPAARVFLRVLQFSSLHKTNISKFNSTSLKDLRESQLRLMWLPL